MNPERDPSAPLVVADLQAHEAKELRDLKRGLSMETLKVGAIVFVAVVGGLFGAWRILLSEARAQTDAGVTTVALEARATQRELERFQREADARFVRLEAAGQRADTKLDALLFALRVPNPAPAPSDAGQ
jgi:hypothetical protein